MNKAIHDSLQVAFEGGFQEDWAGGDTRPAAFTGPIVGELDMEVAAFATDEAAAVRYCCFRARHLGKNLARVMPPGWGRSPLRMRVKGDLLEIFAEAWPPS